MGFRMIHIEIFVLIILLALNVLIFLNGQKLDPEKCKVEFKSQTASEKWGKLTREPLSIKLTDLYSNLTNGTCLVKWSGTQGYIPG